METIMQGKSRIESEFEEPLRDVVSGFAQMGYSKPLIAEALEVSEPSLRHYAWKSGIRFAHSPAVHRDINGRPGRCVRHAGRAMSLTEWASELGVSVECVRKRLRTRGRVMR